MAKIRQQVLKVLFPILLFLISIQPERALSQKPGTFQPHLKDIVTEVQPQNGWDRFVVPVSVHVTCESPGNCAKSKGVPYSAAFFGRVVDQMSKDIEPPNNSFYKGGYKGVGFVLARYTEHVSPEVYHWREGVNPDAWIKDRIASGDDSFTGYLNVVVTAGSLCGVAGGNQSMSTPPRVFLGVGCLADDTNTPGRFGSGVLTHEVMHVLGLGHLVEGEGHLSHFRDPECGSDFQYVVRSNAFSPVTRDGTLYPERNHFMGISTIGKGPLGAWVGPPSLYGPDAYALGDENQSYGLTDGIRRFPARYDYLTQVVVACWAYRNYVLHPVPETLKSYPMIEFRAPTFAGAVVSENELLVAVDVFDWRGRGLKKISLAVDGGSGIELTLQGKSPGRFGTIFHYQASLPVHQISEGSHEVQVHAINLDGVESWNSRPVRVLRPKSDRCVRFEACVDGVERLSVDEGVFKVEHVSWAPLGRHPFCRYLSTLKNAATRLDGINEGLFFLNEQLYLLKDPASGNTQVGGIAINEIRKVRVVEGRGQIGHSSGVVTLDDRKDGGPSRYVVDLCE